MDWDGIEIVKRLLKEKHIVLRERTSIETMLYAVFLYLGGLSLKGVKTRLLTVVQRNYSTSLIPPCRALSY
jgi:hypothetical protein